MAKKHTETVHQALPSVEQVLENLGVGVTAEVLDNSESNSAQPPPLKTEADGTISIQLPTGRPGIENAYHQRHINLQLNLEQARALSGIHNRLLSDAVKLKNGRRVQSKADSVRFILEAIAAAG
jgi:hypothetical protein